MDEVTHPVYSPVLAIAELSVELRNCARALDGLVEADKDNRTIPLTAEFKAFLGGYGLPAPFMLMPHVPKGAYKYRYDFRKPFEEYVKRWGAAHEPSKEMAWLTPHVMRHTFASLHAIAGTSIYKIAVWLGDGVEVVQRHYAKLAPSDADINKAFEKPILPRGARQKKGAEVR